MIADEKMLEAEIVSKGLEAPRVSFQDVQDNIEEVEIVKHVTRRGQILRWAVITTKNGYAVVGRPSCSVSKENDNLEIGVKIAESNARAEMWPLMGYALRQSLHEELSQLAP